MYIVDGGGPLRVRLKLVTSTEYRRSPLGLVPLSGMTTAETTKIFAHGRIICE